MYIYIYIYVYMCVYTHMYVYAYSHGRPVLQSAHTHLKQRLERNT